MKTSLLLSRIGATAFSMICVWCGATALSAAPSAQPIWSIGKPDGRSIEFAPGVRGKVLYEIGKAVAARDFPGHQSGSAGFDGRTNEKPYTIMFDLKEPQAGP